MHPIFHTVESATEYCNRHGISLDNIIRTRLDAGLVIFTIADTADTRALVGA